MLYVAGKKPHILYLQWDAYDDKNYRCYFIKQTELKVCKNDLLLQSSLDYRTREQRID